jgi:hypothetical protein
MSDLKPNLIEEKDMPFPRTTLWRLRRRRVNPLPHYRIGRRIYYSKDHLNALLRSCEQLGNNQIQKEGDA